MPKRTPVRINKETHLKLIILLLILIAVLLVVSRCLGGDEPNERVVRVAPVAPVVPRAVPPTANDVPIAVVEARLELPASADQQFLLQNKEGRYTLYYDTAARQARWVAYLLTRAEVKTKGTARKNNFRPDPQLLTRGWPAARDRDYTRSGYDRGHLLPSADRDDTPAENSATFLLSNIAPQRPALNRGVWKLLEEQVRRWAVRYDSLYVVTGGLLDSLPKSIGSGVAVPDRFFKAVLVRDGSGGYRTAAFLIPNLSTFPETASSFRDYTVTVNELESVSGFDLFHHLPDEVEESVEADFDARFWR